MYRTQPDAAEKATPASIDYHPERRGHDASTPAMVQLLTPLLVAAAVAAVGLPLLAIPAFVAAVIATRVARHRARTRPAATLSIEGSMLRVSGPDSKEMLLVPLEEVLDLELDTRSVEPVQEAPGPIPELMFVNATVGPAIDRSRIAVVTLRSGSLQLTEELGSHGDALEWRGKMRQFLRKHGWVPAREREPQPPVKG